MLTRVSGNEFIAFLLASSVMLGPLAAATYTRHADPQTVKESGAVPPNAPPPNAPAAAPQQK
jgi:hypothetical protein